METHEADCWKNANMAKIVQDRPSWVPKASLLYWRVILDQVITMYSQRTNKTQDVVIPGDLAKRQALLWSYQWRTGTSDRCPQGPPKKKEHCVTESLRAYDFLQIAKRLETMITSINDNEAARHVAKNRKLLWSIISCIVFYGKLNFAL